MIIELRIKVAAGLLISVVSVLCGAQMRAESHTAVAYSCDGGETVFTQRDKTAAQARSVPHCPDGAGNGPTSEPMASIKLGSYVV